MLDARQLDALAAVADTGSFAAAARQRKASAEQAGGRAEAAELGFNAELARQPTAGTGDDIEHLTAQPADVQAGPVDQFQSYHIFQRNALQGFHRPVGFARDSPAIDQHVGIGLAQTACSVALADRKAGHLPRHVGLKAAALMLLVISTVGVAVALYSVAYIREYQGKGDVAIGVLMNLFLFAMVGMVLAVALMTLSLRVDLRTAAEEKLLGWLLSRQSGGTL